MSCRETPHALLLCVARPEIISSYKKMVVKLLTYGMSLSVAHHAQVERAISSGALIFQKPDSVNRFLFLLTELDETRDLEYKTIILAFLYALVTYPDDIHARMRLRAELDEVPHSFCLM